MPDPVLHWYNLRPPDDGADGKEKAKEGVAGEDNDDHKNTDPKVTFRQIY